MRFHGLLLMLLGLCASALSLGLFGSAVRGIASVNPDTGEVIWIPMARDGQESTDRKRICVFCRDPERRR
ncbi:hypothetical protein Q1695_003161 [Nippostrongylus brasiliensis]|nr:hypothetical protein Q1695_003161 [Nippostrongylus brasiliensis]